MHPIDDAARMPAIGDTRLDAHESATIQALTRLAAGIIRTRRAVVSLVDERGRLHEVGHSGERDDSALAGWFCRLTVANAVPVVVPDAQSDARFVDTPLFRSHDCPRFYAGIPLQWGDGRARGALCAIDPLARAPDERELELFEQVASLVARQLEGARRRMTLERRAAADTAQRFDVLLRDRPALGYSPSERAGEAVDGAAARSRGIEETGRSCVGRGRILLVDDEPAVLASTRRALERENDVVALDDPREALRILLAGADFDVIFCDLVMPYLGGDELYEQVVGARPELAPRFVFMTGGARDRSAERFFTTCTNTRLEKPFALADLRAIAVHLVGARRASRDTAGG